MDLLYSRLPAPAIKLWLQTINVENDFSNAWLLYMREHFLSSADIQTPLHSPEIACSLSAICKQLNHKPHGHFKLGWYKNLLVPMEEEPTIGTESVTLIEEKERYHESDPTKELLTDSQPLSSLQEVNAEATEETSLLPASLEVKVLYVFRPSISTSKLLFS